jgi:signal transduction histidine kinase
MKKLLYRPILLTAIAAGVVWLAAALAHAITTVKTLDRLDLIATRVAYSRDLQETGLRLEETLVADLSGGETVDRQRLAQLRREVLALELPQVRADGSTESRLHQVDLVLADLRRTPGEALLAAVQVFREVLAAERLAQLNLVRQLHRETLAELWLSSGVLGALLALSLLGAFFLRRRVFGPLGDLRSLLAGMADGQFAPMPTGGADPVLLPLLENYNRMVTRLAELEEARRLRTRDLEAEVRAASGALLEQQQSLARAERLAATGEMAAAIAHELRNPLSGVQMVLTNLLHETPEPDAAARLGSAVAELERTSHLLDSLLEEARHTPEPARPTDVGALVEDLLALLRYQVPPAVALTSELDGDLTCRLPEGRLRQALMNLVLNAAQALGNGGGTVEVRAERREGELEIAVADDGPGFPPELLDGGVRPFASRRPGGTGLGLALVRRFARDLGGELRLANREPRGARATLRLPAGGGEHG